MSNKKFISDHDIQLFRKATKDVRPLRPEKRNSFSTLSEKTQPRPKPEKPFFKEDENSSAEQNHNSYVDYREDSLELLGRSNAVSPQDSLLFIRPGLQNKKIKKLKNGSLPISDSLDLHGMTASEALEALDTFFRNDSISEQHCLLIIHGKGQNTPVLKNLVNQYLKQQQNVLAFCSAPQHLGGTGAVLILTKSIL